MARRAEYKYGVPLSGAFLVLWLCTAVFGGQQSPDIVISEIMFNPDGDENAREYVEILNCSSAALSLEGWKISDGSGFDAIVPAGGGGWEVSGLSYALILDPDYFTGSELYDIPENTSLFTVVDSAIGDRGLSNSTAETVSLISVSGDTLTAVTYALDCPEGHSWERVMPGGGDGPDNFLPSRVAGGTPGLCNSVTPAENNPALDENSLRFIPPHPTMGDDIEIVVSYRNAGLEPSSVVSVAVWIEPDITVGTAVFSHAVEPSGYADETIIGADGLPGGKLSVVAAVVWTGSGDASDDTVRVALDAEVPPGMLSINEVMAAPEGGGPEWIEVFNNSDTPVDLFGWRIADSSGGLSDTVSRHVFLPGHGYGVIGRGEPPYTIPADVPVITVSRFPALNNDGDTVTLIDFTGVTVADSMTYHTAPAGVSLERISSENGTGDSGWDVSVDPAGATPGRRNSLFFGADGDRESVVLKAEPNPFEGEVALSYRLPFPLARVRLSVYDRRGRLVEKICDGEESGSEWSGTWDGKSGGSRLPAGPYILFLEALDRQSGTVYHERTVLVIARRL